MVVVFAFTTLLKTTTAGTMAAQIAVLKTTLPIAFTA
jgi:hypothetical protein